MKTLRRIIYKRFLKWKKITFETDLAYKLNFYIKEESRLQYLQSIFSSFKNVIKARKYDRHNSMRKTFNLLKLETHKQRHLKLMSKIVEKFDNQKKNVKVEQTFEHLKLNNAYVKSTEAEIELYEAIPHREVAQSALGDEVGKTDH